MRAGHDEVPDDLVALGNEMKGLRAKVGKGAPEEPERVSHAASSRRLARKRVVRHDVVRDELVDDVEVAPIQSLLEEPLAKLLVRHVLIGKTNV